MACKEWGNFAELVELVCPGSFPELVLLFRRCQQIDIYLAICCTGVFPSHNATISHHPGTFPTAGTVGGSRWRNFCSGGQGNYPPQQCSAEKVGSKSRQSGAWTSKKKIRDGRGAAKRQIRGVPHSCFLDFLAAAVAAASEPPARRTGKGAMISSHECMVLLPQNHNVPMQKNLRRFPSADWGWRRRMFFPDSLVTRIRRRRSSAIRRNDN